MRYAAVSVDLVVATTADALLLRVGSEEEWVPRSQTEDADDLEKGDTDVEVNIATWLATKLEWD